MGYDQESESIPGVEQAVREKLVIRSAALILLLLAVLVSGALAESEEKVAFNVETKKYHCLSCHWALKCTRNCIEVSKSEAKRRGGVACKVCGGSCG
ncbi:MAG: hypothetical protein ABUT39_14990 [Acidobacteriota bacterium]